MKHGRSPRVACRSVEEGPVPREGVRPAVVRRAVCSSTEEGAAPVALAGRDVTALASGRGATMTRVSRPPAAAPVSNVKVRGEGGSAGVGIHGRLAVARVDGEERPTAELVHPAAVGEGMGREKLT